MSADGGDRSTPTRRWLCRDARLPVDAVTKLLLRNNAHLAVIGLEVSGANAALDVVSAGTGLVSHDIGFFRVGFNCSVTTSDDACFALSDGTHDVLVDDAWGWGGRRYIVLVYGRARTSSQWFLADKRDFFVESPKMSRLWGTTVGPWSTRSE